MNPFRLPVAPKYSQITNKSVSVRYVSFMRLDLCYGIWQSEQDNVLKAKDDLEKVRLICVPIVALIRCSRTQERY
jgi:hypothetical protein